MNTIMNPMLSKPLLNKLVLILSQSPPLPKARRVVGDCPNEVIHRLSSTNAMAQQIRYKTCLIYYRHRILIIYSGLIRNSLIYSN